MMMANERPILIVIGNYKNGGNAKQASVLANGFAILGLNVTIIVTKEISEKRFFELNQNVSLVDINHCDELGSTKEYKRFLNKLAVNLKAKKIIAKLYRNSTKQRMINFSVSKMRNHKKLNWIISRYHNPIIIPLGLEYAVNVYGVTNRNSDIILATKTYAEGELKSINKDIAKAVLCGMNCVVCQTHYTKEYFKNIGVTNLEVIYNPLIMDVLPYGGDKSKKIVNFCRISREKNLELLIDAFSKLYLQFPEYRIEVYGNVINEQEEKYKRELLNKISALNLSKAIKIHLAVKNIHDIIQDAAMFISTSNFEGLSNSMIEAMALGIPCICTDCDGGGAREMIEDGVNGLLVPKGDVESLYEAMLQFAKNEQFAAECGKRAINVRNKTSVDTVIKQWISVIEQYC